MTYLSFHYSLQTKTRFIDNILVDKVWIIGLEELLRGYQIEDIRVEHVCDYHQGLTASCIHILAPSSFSSNNLVCQIIPHYPYIISSFLTECIYVLKGLWHEDLGRAE